MPHSPELIERMLKEAGLFDNVKSWFSGFFAPKPPGSKEKKRALSRVDAHFGAKEKDWDRLVDNASRKSFAKAMAGDRRADAKLKMHVDNINRLKTGKVLGTVQGTEGSRTARRDGSQSYKIIKLRGSDRLGCTCRDWRFKKSVAQPGEQVDCKHVRQFKQMNKTAAHPSYDAQMQALSPAEQRKLRAQEVRNEKKYGRKDFWKDPRYRADVSMRFPPMFPSKRSWRDLTDADYRKIVAQYKKCRTDRDRYMALRMELQRLGIPKKVWREKVRAPGGTWKTAGHVEDRIAERAPGSTYEIAKIRARIPHMNFRKGQTYHVPLKGGKGYVVIGDVGKKHVVKTVLGPNMRPPGQRLALR